MRTHYFFILAVAIITGGFVGCQSPSSTEETIPATFAAYQTDPEFGEYWYQGKAEITSYDLQQARYGDIHPGHAVLIFVTEDFSKSKQVKLDNPQAAGDDGLTVMKLNLTKKFVTGIYPYSMMQSTFTPISLDQYPHALKVTTSSQEWCGHTFLQLNADNKKYRVQGYSYFESEGDNEFSLNKTWLEDELWTVIRLAPESLPTGSFDIIPGTFFSRLKHVQLKVVAAQATLNTTEDQGLMEYELTYPQYNRSLKIRFRQNFPHEIESWEESQGEGSNALVTTATRKVRMMEPYWTQNGVNDRAMRAKLGLE